MAAPDTNVLIRYLVQDDRAQGESASRLIGRALRTGSALFVPITVVLELEWVLRSAFGFEKAAVLTTLSRLLGSFELSFQSESAVEVALVEYEQGTADFADCVHAALADHAGEAPLWTFDRSAAKVGGAKLLA